MLNQKALDYIVDVNTKIDAKLSRHFRDMERVYAVIARAAAKRRQWEEEKSEHGPHFYLPTRRTPWRTTWNGMASIGPATRSPSLHSQVRKSPARASASCSGRNKSWLSRGAAKTRRGYERRLALRER